MLKWFHRDKIDPKVAVVPTAEHAAAPAHAERAEAVAPEAPVETGVAVETPLVAVPGVRLDVGAAPPLADPEAPAVLATQVAQPTPAPEPVTNAETAVPWWRYEGVWRKPKTPAPVAEVPSAPVAEAPSTRVPVAPPGVEVPVVVAPAERDLGAAHVADSPARRGVDLAPVTDAPLDRAETPARSGPAARPADTSLWQREPSPAAASDDAVPTLFAAEPQTAQEPVPELARPRSLRERLAATARALTASVGSLFKRNPKLDDDLLEELETALIQADVGVMASTELVAKLGVRMRKREFADAQALLAALRTDLRALIVNHARPLNIPAAPRPFVILTVGVNGAGKTTTIGKLAMRYKQAGHSVMLAAGDTFRAAAVEQLKTWGDRNQVTVIAQGSGADSASVIFDALQAAKSRNIDVLIADTAGRLHTQGHLMQELAKVKRVLGKIDPEAPHETLLVIDGGTGQNALNQAKQFHQAVGLTGIVVTKLDGTAKGGMVFALCRELGLPIRFIGVGEKREDLREFDAEDFVDALLPRELGG